MEKDIRYHARITIDTLRSTIEFECSLGEPEFYRSIGQLQGVALLLYAVEGVDDLKSEIKALIADLQEK